MLCCASVHPLVWIKGISPGMCNLCNLAADSLGSAALSDNALAGPLSTSTISSNTLTGKWGSSTALGSSGGVVTWSFAASNYILQAFQFDSFITQPIYQADVRAAFARWEQVANIHFVEQFDSVQSNIRLGWDAIDGPKKVIGETSWSAFNQSFTSALIRFDAAENYTTGGMVVVDKVNFYTLALHEIGHALGLSHDDTQASVMNSRQSSSVRDLTLSDVASIQTIYGGPAIAGGDGNDTLRGTTGNDTFYGGFGRDTVVLAGARAVYSVTQTTEGWRVTGPSGNDLLVLIERIRFDDGTLVLDSNDPAASVYRLYQAALNRTPDALGLIAWVNAEATGTTMPTMAGQFMQSSEFTGRYGDPDNAGFVDLLYQNVLGRSGEADGAAFWLNGLTSGRATRAEVLLGFSESAENIALVGSTTQTGIWLA